MSPRFNNREKKRQRLFIKAKNQKIIYKTTSNSRVSSPIKQSTQFYIQKLHHMISKKQSLSQEYVKLAAQRVKRNSIEYRKQQSAQISAMREKEEQSHFLSSTLLQFLKKLYVVKCLANPLEFAREMKIKVFVHNLKYNRIQKTIRSLFETTRINNDIKRLRKARPAQFLRLILVFKNYIHRWRKGKKKTVVSHCVRQIMILNLRNRFKMGVQKIRTGTKNLQKIGSWLQLVRKQKIKCLNSLWKRQILNLMSVNEQHQIQWNSLNVKFEPKTFREMYNEKVKANPMLKIENYLECSPLFKIKMIKCTDLKLLVSKTQQQKQLKRQKQISQRKKLQKRKLRAKQEEQAPDLRNLIYNQNLYLLPYSKHLELISRPRNLQINVKEGMKDPEQWAQYEKQVLYNLFSGILRDDEALYTQNMGRYKRQMAIFIRDNYSKICERRWKYIIEYNKLEKNSKEISKKEKELFQLMRAIGCESFIEKDILPEKHRILDQAKQFKGVPEMPEKYLNFTQKEFRKVFKVYFEVLQNKSKVLKGLKK